MNENIKALQALDDLLGLRGQTPPSTILDKAQKIINDTLHAEQPAEREYECMSSMTFNATTPQDAGQQFLDCLWAHRSWFVDIVDTETGEKWIYDGTDGELEERGQKPADKRFRIVHSVGSSISIMPSTSNSPGYPISEIVAYLSTGVKLSDMTLGYLKRDLGSAELGGVFVTESQEAGKLINVAVVRTQ